jgi:cell division protease FtsH
MVTKWGMSEKLGPLQYEQSQEGYLGMGQTARTMAGAETNKLIDEEIKRLVEEGLKRATDILTSQEDKLHLLAQALLEYETLTGDEIDALMKTGKIDRPDEPRGPTPAVQTQGSLVPKAGKRFGSKGKDEGPAPQGA